VICVSGHAYHRWRARATDAQCGPADAWTDGQSIECPVLDGDEFRYHDATETVLVRKETTLVTVIDVHTASSGVREAVETAGGESA